MNRWTTLFTAAIVLLSPLSQGAWANETAPHCLSKLTRKSVQLSSGTFSYLEAGSPKKPLAVLLHGFPENALAWCNQLADLGTRYHAVALDQRSYGESPVFPEVADSHILKLVQDVSELIGALGQTQAHIIGHDWGAAVAYAFALGAPQMTRSLTIVNGAHPYIFGMLLQDPASRQFQASQYIFQIIGGQLTEDAFLANDLAYPKSMLFGLELFKSEEIQKAYIKGWTRPDGIRGQLNWYRAIDLAHPVTPAAKPAYVVRVPTLVIWGEKDTYLTSENLVGLEEVVSDLQVVRIPDASHWVVHEQPARVSAAIRTFLKRH